MALTADELRELIGQLYQTVSAIVHQNEHPTSDGDAHDAALLDILSDPDALPVGEARTKLLAVQDYYWAKGEPNTTLTPDAARPG